LGGRKATLARQTSSVSFEGFKSENRSRTSKASGLAAFSYIFRNHLKRGGGVVWVGKEKNDFLTKGGAPDYDGGLTGLRGVEL